MASSLLNGESVVVLLFVARILFSAPISLISECVSLLLLSLFALLVEISAESSDALFCRFKIRPGASSGILLGAITLPAVMFSKLIQLSRGLELENIGVEEFEYQKMLYWTASICCFSVPLLLIVLTRHSSCKLSATHWSLGAISSIFVVYILKDYPSALNLLWMLVHCIAAIRLFEHIFHVFPSCASLGEALLVTSGLVVYVGDMIRTTIVKGSWESAAADFGSGVERSEISIIIQGVLLGLLFFPLFLNFAFRFMDCLRCSNYYVTGDCNNIPRSLIFFGSLALNLTVVIPSWVQFVQDFQMHPLLWVIAFVFSEPLKRLSLCIYWVAVIYVSVGRFYHISKSSRIERILLRKYYHLMAVLMFVPALVLQPKFLQLAFGAALAVFLVVEITRIWRIWPLGNFIHQFMNAFTDHRDSDLLIVRYCIDFFTNFLSSHFSLLLGCALPLWMSSGFNDRPLAPFAGILSLGIGDTMASMVGHKYGVLRWSKSGKKTIEGTAAGITSMLVACSVLLPLLASTGYILQNWGSLLFAVSVCGLLEAYTAQLDNAFIPLVFYSLLCL